MGGGHERAVADAVGAAGAGPTVGRLRRLGPASVGIVGQREKLPRGDRLRVGVQQQVEQGRAAVLQPDDIGDGLVACQEAFLRELWSLLRPYAAPAVAVSGATQPVRSRSSIRLREFGIAPACTP